MSEVANWIHLAQDRCQWADCCERGTERRILVPRSGDYEEVCHLRYNDV
jgi:hypothetical protein